MRQVKKEKKLDDIRHSLAHILAAAVLAKFPGTKLGIGPVIENGFYYDFKFAADKRGQSRRSTQIGENDLPQIEKEMKKLVKQNLPFKGKRITLSQAKKRFRNEPFKLDLIKEFSNPPAGGKKQPLTIYSAGNIFSDLCRGGHVKNTREINADAFKLTNIAGAYWRGNEKNPMLTRIYAVAFNTKKELNAHLKLIEEAKKRDHRKIGKDLDLFLFREEVGPGLPLWTEKGTVIRRELERFIVDEEIKRGYKHVYTPDIAKVKLYEISGHYPYYKDAMYPVMKVDKDRLVLRPMTCPHHFMLYSSRPRSYKELPMRIAEVGKLYRYEKSGELTGLLRVRSFCLADAHIICEKSQAEEEIKNSIKLIDYAIGLLGFKKGKDYSYRLSLGNSKNKKKYFYDPKGWRIGEATLRKVLKSIKAPFDEIKDDAAFYGPKIDIQMKNVLGKEETAFTVQYDFCLPSRFKLRYINKKGKEEQPIVIHRSSIGAIERTVAFLIEHYAGAFPLWLAPIQARILPVSKKFALYAEKIKNAIGKEAIRVEIDDADETLSKRIRSSELDKIPYTLIVGKKEQRHKSVNVRHYKKGVLGELELKKLAAKLKSEIEKKTI